MERGLQSGAGLEDRMIFGSRADLSISAWDTDWTRMENGHSGVSWRYASHMGRRFDGGWIACRAWNPGGLDEEQASFFADGTEDRIVAGEQEHAVGPSQCGEVGQLFGFLCAEQVAATGEGFLAETVGEEAEVAHANEALGKDMGEEAPQELDGLQLHDLYRAAVGVVLVAEGHPAVLQLQQASVGDGGAVGVAGEVVERLFRTAEGRLGIDEPLLDRKSVV